MPDIMFALGLASVMLLLGMLLRSVIPFFRTYMVPACVIGGFLGLALMNLDIVQTISIATFGSIIMHLFVIVFISIILAAPKTDSKSEVGKQVIKGSLALGTFWNVMYAGIALVGAGVTFLIGGFWNMDPIYGLLLQFGFIQGPGQAATFGAMIEGYGWENAITVGLMYAVIGFAVAFLVGVPLVKLGLKRRLPQFSGDKLHEAVTRGYYTAEEQEKKEAPSMGTQTTYTGNIDSLTFHFALVGLCFFIAIFVTRMWLHVPGAIGTNMNAMPFMNGIFVAVVVRWLMIKLKIDYLKCDVTQTKITAWASDYLVIISFMAVGLHFISAFIVPMLILSLIVTVVSLAAALYFAPRVGGPNAFERVVAYYVYCTGTAPTVLVLVRVIDPEMKTTTGAEVGLMALPALLSQLPVVFIVMSYASGAATLGTTMAMLGGLVVLYLVMLKLFGCWNKPTLDMSLNRVPEESNKAS